MTYKYRAMNTLARMIEAEQVSPDVDIRQALKQYCEVSKPVRRYEAKWKPRFYNRAMSANTRARRCGAPGRITANDLEYVYKKTNGRCARCNTTKHLVFDHIKPYYRGGDNVPENLQLLCRLCNMEKGVGA